MIIHRVWKSEDEEIDFPTLTEAKQYVDEYFSDCEITEDGEVIDVVFD